MSNTDVAAIDSGLPVPAQITMTRMGAQAIAHRKRPELEFSAAAKASGPSHNTLTNKIDTVTFA